MVIDKRLMEMDNTDFFYNTSTIMSHSHTLYLFPLGWGAVLHPSTLFLPVALTNLLLGTAKAVLT